MNDSIEASIKESGIEEDTYLYKLYPKMCELLISSKSDNTVKSYFNSFKRWQSFIYLQGHNALPAQPVHVALYLTHLINSGSTYHPVYNAIYGIKWAHEINGLLDPTDNNFVISILEAAKRVAPKKVDKKEPITKDALIQICDMFKHSTDALVVRDLTMMVLSFSGFLRFDELVSLRFCDVILQESHLILNIQKSKTDQYRQGSEVLVSKGETSACPYSMYVRYVKLVNFILSPKDFYLFRPVFRSSSICKLINKNKKLSYTAARESILKRVKLVLPNCNIGLHSFRSGGATAAANADVSDRCLKKHGRWRSDASKDGYIVDSIENRLHVSKCLGL